MGELKRRIILKEQVSEIGSCSSIIRSKVGIIGLYRCS